MMEKHFIFNLLRLLLALLMLHVPFEVQAAVDMENLLPPISCGSGWKIEGKPVFYDRDTLSDRINGEAELYFPYGFDRMAASRYASGKSPGVGIDVEIYRMGSLLDAFGMYANYRQKEGRSLNAGAESNLSGSQLFFYQGRFFVHLQQTGSNAGDPEAMTACAREVASLLPGDKNRPAELSVFERPEIVRGTERYLPQSLLGYDFMHRGLMAEAVLEGAGLQLFLLLGTAAEPADAVFEHYRTQLVQGKMERGEKGLFVLEGIDPLYGPVIVIKKNGCLAGVIRFSGKNGALALLESVCKR